MGKISLLKNTEIRNKQRVLRTSSVHQALPKAYHYAISAFGSSLENNRKIPKEIIFLRPNPLKPEFDQLFLDQCPISKTDWKYNDKDQELIWDKAYGGGYLKFLYIGHGGYGMIGKNENAISVNASSSVSFLCDIAPDCGAYYEEEGEKISGIVWDSNSDKWKNAVWEDKRLLLKYTVTSGSAMAPPEFSFQFEDKKDGSRLVPMPSEFAAGLNLGTDPSGQMVWMLTFFSNVEKIGPIFPLYGVFQEDVAVSKIEGAMNIEKKAPEGSLVGIKGVRCLPTAVGYYCIKNKQPFGLFNGEMYVAGKRVDDAVMNGNVLEWCGLPESICKSTGLARFGSIRFAEDGTPRGNENDLLLPSRLDADAAFVFTRHVNQINSLSNGLSITTLLAMNPYVQDSSGAWEEQIQKKVTQDMSTIMNSYISSEMWNILYPQTPQCKLEGYLAEIASESVEGEIASDWYKNLSTAVLVSGLAEGNEENCQYMNGIRANKWIKEETSKSKIYYAHSQKLFDHHWRAYFPEINKFLEDQDDEEKSEEHNNQIDQQVELLLADIEQNVVETADNPNLKDNLRQQVTETGNYAKDNNLYWAYAYYTYNVAPGMLANIAFAINFSTAPDDKMSLSRLLQKNISTLTILDPSGFICREYVSTINTFLATNVLASHLDYSDSLVTFDMIKEYMQVFVEQNLQSKDDELRQMAIHLQELIADGQADDILKTALEILSDLADSTAEIMEYPFIAEKLVEKLSAKFPITTSFAKGLGVLFFGALSGLSIWQFILDAKEWDEMSKLEKAELIYAGVVFGTAILAGALKRGVRVGAIFEVSGMTPCQRFSAVSSVLISGEAVDLDVGLASIGNKVARWFGDTHGSVGKIPVLDMDTGRIILYESGKSVSKVAKMFGRNMEEVVVKSVGAFLIISGVYFSIRRLQEGEKGMERSMEIVSLCSDALMLFAIVGGWAIAGGLIAEGGILATCISIAGPLAILLVLAGVGMMLYLLFKKPASPIQKFVNKYVKPTDWYLEKRYRSIDYVLPYIDPNAEILLPGFSLSCTGVNQNPIHTDEHKMRLASINCLPDSVWKCSTDGNGITRFATIVYAQETNSYYTVLLSLLDNGTVCFMKPKSENDGIKTQYWKVAIEGDVKLISSKSGQQYVNSMDILLQAVDENGNSIDNKYMVYKDGEFYGSDRNKDTGLFHLRMSSLAPNYLQMKDMNFICNKVQAKGKVYGPSMGVSPSTPMKFTISPAQPDFLSFNSSTGQLTTNGNKVSLSAGNYTYTLKCENDAGNAEVDFNIIIKPEKKW